jgi:thiol-disulfide isomerase/thioredoxin
VAGLASLSATRVAFAADDTASPIAHGALAQNPLARAFESAPADLPSVTLVGPDGERSIADLKGRTILMPLWAEWCAPCLSEIPDLARLQTKYGNDRFAIVPVLTGTAKKMTPKTVGQIFAYLHAEVFEPLIEYQLGGRLMRTMAKNGVHYTIPCNLLIAPDGHCVAREFGLKPSDEAQSAQVSATRSSMIAHAEAGDILSLWGKPVGEEFAAAMANGFLG